MGRDLRRELDEFDGQYPESWVPQPGDLIVGGVLRYEIGRTPYGTNPIVVLRDEENDEERAVWLLHSVLLNAFKTLRPRVGERIGIKRLEDADKGYRRYVLRADRPEPSVDEILDDADGPGDVPSEELEELAALAQDDAFAVAHGPDDDRPF